MSKNLDGLPRRCCTDKWSVGEKAIQDAIDVVEGMGASPLLTNAVVTLLKAREEVADFVDALPAKTATMEMRGRKVTREEALDAARRLVNSHFHNPDSARCSIPVRCDDDDVTVVDYVLEQESSDGG